MLLRRPLRALTLPLLRPHLSTAAAAAAEAVPADHHPDPLSPPFDYLSGHPRPDAKHDELILAVPRASSGRHVAAKERKAGRVPAIVFEQENGQEGGNKRLDSVQSKQIRKLVDHLGRSFFLSRLFRLQVWSEHAGQGELIESVRVLPRNLAIKKVVAVLGWEGVEAEVVEKGVERPRDMGHPRENVREAWR
ncbi:hypothetical protein E2562_032305 [Oryza meyeriana var. granulata]|uniref:Large ribosomal subunit protein bL25 L25 domain-containing protein n=1 Tax=Oryza meyeriana var. granulata TaxID=110450 RepID=A0A6G1ERU5_9ORYZ|nr:hypothetical protein E2562_032305 [Oryza meyeriana var. granulata]